jgi:hypothetical protein
MADPDDDLADAVEELTRTIDELRTELRDTQRRPRRRSLAPRPPTPDELLRLADDVAIPALLAVLESSVRTLEALQRGLDIVRTERELRGRADETAGRTKTRADEVRRTTLSQLDTVLAELQRAASEGTLPADDDARELLSEARTLRDEVDSRLRRAVSDGTRSSETGESADGPIRIDIDRPDDSDENDPDDPTDEPETSVDVDAELETLKDRYAADESAAGENETADDETTDEGEDEDDDQAGSNR